EAANKASVHEIEQLRARLQEAEDTLRAIYNGEVDAVVVSGPEGDQVFTLKGAEHPYRVFLEEMSEGAVTLTPEGMVLYCNRRFAEIIRAPLERVIASSIYQFLAQSDRPAFEALLQDALTGSSKIELSIGTEEGSGVPVYLSA